MMPPRKARPMAVSVVTLFAAAGRGGVGGGGGASLPGGRGGGDVDGRWGGVGDVVLIEGVELGGGLAFAGGEGEDEVGLTAGDGEFRTIRQRFGDEIEGFTDGADGLRGCCGCGIDGEVEA